MEELNIAKDFSKTPAGRSEEAHGHHSGETFRESMLWPKLDQAIKSNTELKVVLDGTAGYPASFLDEAFGGLIRKGYCNIAQVSEHLKIKAHSPAYEVYKRLIDRYIGDAKCSNDRRGG